MDVEGHKSGKPLESSSEQIQIRQRDLKAIMSASSLSEEETRVANSMVGLPEDPRVWTESAKPIEIYDETRIEVPKNPEIRKLLAKCRHEKIQYPDAESESMSDRSTTTASDEESLTREMADAISNNDDRNNF